MSSSPSNPWAAFAEILREGVESYVSTQRSLLNIAAQQNAMWVKAASQGFGVAAAPEVADLLDHGARAVLTSQEASLDVALQQNKLALNFVIGMLDGPARPYLDELANLLQQSAQTFVDAQKKLLEFAGQQADTMMKASRDSGGVPPNPLSQMVELSRQAVNAFIEAQKRFLDLLAQQAAGATRPTQPANDLLNQARQSVQNYLTMQRQFLETATAKMADPASLNPIFLNEAARQGVEAFITTQRAILDLMFRSIYPAGASMGQ